MKKKKSTCPCGSGKLYSQCCGAKIKVVSLTQYRWRRIAQKLRYKLGEFAESLTFAREIARAKYMYMENFEPELVSSFDEFIMERFFEWFIFDYRLINGTTIIELYLKTPDLSEEEKKLLKCWLNARITLFEVLEIIPGRGVVLKDLLNNNEVTVNDTGIAEEIYPGMILLMRILKVGGGFEFSTSGLGLPAFCKEELMNKIQDDLKHFCQQRGLSFGKGIDLYLRERSCLLNTWVIELGCNCLMSEVEEIEEENEIDQIAWQITSAFLDEYYERWINRPLPALDGMTPRQACKTDEGRERVRKILQELEQIEIEREQNGENAYDFKKIWKKLGLKKDVADYYWMTPKYALVARQVVEELKLRGYNYKQLDSALRLWHDYCRLVHPSFRKTSGWVASVVYTMARLESDRKINQHDLAMKYGIATSTISNNFRNMCRDLELAAFDRRYSTRRLVLPISGNAYPLAGSYPKKH